MDRQNRPRYLNPKNDRAFKRIFGTQKNKDILIHFLNDIFARTTNPIEKITIENPAQDPRIASERTSYVDIFCTDAEGNRFIVEMQVTDEKDFIKRAQYYAAKTYLEQRGENANYKGLKEVIFLAIANFTLFPDKADYLSHHVMLDKKTYERDLEDFSFSFLELPKFKKKKEKLVTLIEKWAFFFKHANKMNEEDVKQIVGSDQIIAKAYKEVDRFNWTKEELDAYEDAELQHFSVINSLDTAREKGKIEGKEEEKIGIAKKMVALGYEPTEIAQITGLSIDQVNSLKIKT